MKRYKRKVIIVIEGTNKDRVEEIVNALEQDTTDYTAHDTTVFIDDVLEYKPKTEED